MKAKVEVILTFEINLLRGTTEHNDATAQLADWKESFLRNLPHDPATQDFQLIELIP